MWIPIYPLAGFGAHNIRLMPISLSCPTCWVSSYKTREGRRGVKHSLELKKKTLVTLLWDSFSWTWMVEFILAYFFRCWCENYHLELEQLWSPTFDPHEIVFSNTLLVVGGSQFFIPASQNQNKHIETILRFHTTLPPPSLPFCLWGPWPSKGPCSCTEDIHPEG